MIRATHATLAATDRGAPPLGLGVLTPDWVLPAQQPARYRAHETGCRELLRAVLDQALTDLRLSADVRAPRHPRPNPLRVSRALRQAQRRQDAPGAARVRTTVTALQAAWQRWDARADTIAWFESTDASHLYAFEVICAHLGLEASAIRRTLRAHGWAPRGPQLPRTLGTRLLGAIGVAPLGRDVDAYAAAEVRTLLCQLRQRGWTGTALSDATGIPASTISAWRMAAQPGDPHAVLAALRPLLTQPAPGPKPSGRAAAAART